MTNRLFLAIYLPTEIVLLAANVTSALTKNDVISHIIIIIIIIMFLENSPMFNEDNL
jgi:hypothetical protein